MIQYIEKKEDIELVRKDVCARLIYGVFMCPINIEDFDGLHVIPLDAKYWETYSKCEVLQSIPYLRPMSSMTEEEEKEYDATFETIYVNGHYDSVMTYKTFDWLNKKMFDYRGLIPMGLALEALEGMYNLNKV